MRDRIAGAVLVLIVLAAQTYWMGPAVIFLSGGLVVSYARWIASGWNNDPTAVLPPHLPV